MEKSEEEKLKEYKEGVEYLAENRIDLLFPNPSSIHAAIVLTNILKFSDSSISIYDNELNGDLINLDNNFPLSFEEARSSNKEINVFLESQNNIKQDLFNRLKSIGVKFFVASEEFKRNVIKYLGKNFYFAVGDDSIFRLESSEDERKALCSFNNYDYPKSLLKIIHKSKSSCETL